MLVDNEYGQLLLFSMQVIPTFCHEPSKGAMACGDKKKTHTHTHTQKMPFKLIDVQLGSPRLLLSTLHTTLSLYDYHNEIHIL